MVYYLAGAIAWICSATMEVGAGGATTGNPFRWLQERREAAEADEARACEAKRQAAARQEVADKILASQYDDMVKRVLGQLTEAAYPRCSVSGYLVGPEPNWMYRDSSWQALDHEPFWEIGSWGEDRQGGKSWSVDIRVILRRRRNGAPRRFECWRLGGKGRREFSGLVEPELVNALQKLHA